MTQFNCTAIFPYPSCSFLITYCNNKYHTAINWCDCMSDASSDMASECTNVGFFIGTFLVILIGFVILVIICVNITNLNCLRKILFFTPYDQNLNALQHSTNPPKYNDAYFKNENCPPRYNEV